MVTELAQAAWLRYSKYKENYFRHRTLEMQDMLIKQTSIPEKSIVARAQVAVNSHGDDQAAGDMDDWDHEGTVSLRDVGWNDIKCRIQELKESCHGMIRRVLLTVGNVFQLVTEIVNEEISETVATSNVRSSTKLMSMSDALAYEKLRVDMYEKRAGRIGRIIFEDFVGSDQGMGW